MIRNQRELGENSERLRDRDLRETREQRCREDRDKGKQRGGRERPRGKNRDPRRGHRDLERRGQKLSRGEK